MPLVSGERHLTMPVTIYRDYTIREDAMVGMKTVHYIEKPAGNGLAWRYSKAECEAIIDEWTDCKATHAGQTPIEWEGKAYDPRGGKSPYSKKGGKALK